ncbi:MAG: GNAT family N-acetyltransferase [Hyphomicrobiales bacterium]
MTGDIADEMFANYVAALARIAELGPGAEGAEVGPFRVMEAGVENPLFNVVVATARASGTDIAAVEGWYRARDAGFRVVVREPVDRELIGLLRARGYTPREREPGMLLEQLPASMAPAPGLDIERVHDLPGALDYADAEPGDDGRDVRAAISRAALALPGCAMLLGRAGGLPVARSMGLVTGEMVGVYNVYVRPEYRRRGFGEALTAAALLAGAEQGAKRATLSATELGYPVYERMGFKTLFDFVSYWPPSAG